MRKSSIKPFFEARSPKTNKSSIIEQSERLKKISIVLYNFLANDVESIVDFRTEFLNSKNF